MTRYFHAMGTREKAYYHLMFSREFRRLLPWYEWYETLSPMIATLFPFSLVGAGDTVLQVGANGPHVELRGGSQPLLLAHRVGPTGRVVAIEPDPASIERLEQAKITVGVPWIELTQYAASDRPGVLQGKVVSGHFYFWDPVVDIEGDVGKISRDSCPELKELWDAVEQAGETVTVRANRLDNILNQMQAAPSFINVTINGYEPTAIRGLGEHLKRDIAIAFPARALEAFWQNGFLEELEALGFALILSNTPHQADYTWFPYITAVRPSRIPTIDNLLEGQFIEVPDQHVIGFVDANGDRML